jgi:hypothetical protein
VLVYPEDGRSRHVTSVTVEASDVSGVDSLYFRMHQPFYHVGGNRERDERDGFDVEGAASIRVNGGAWVDIRDRNVDCAYPEDQYWCVGGTMSTIRFTMPAGASGALVNGANTIDFRFNGTDGIRAGYRVLGIGLMTGADPVAHDFDAYDGDYNGDGVADGAIDGTSFVLEDPSTWRAPDGGDAADGRALWTERNALVDGDGTPITASCADCHFQGGEDLKYFNFSNRSIVSRARFHGLTQAQGKDLAAYIRSLSLETESGRTYEAPGTPWDPPFQPGPRMLGSDRHPDKGPAAYWMAGAGLEWVLEGEREAPGTERDMLAHIFPEDGDPARGVDYIESGPYAGDLNWRRIHADSTLNMRAIPITTQFPDWNAWLPDLHPLDFEPNLASTAEWDYITNEFPAAFESGNVFDVFRAVSRARQRMQRFGWPKGISAAGMIGSPTDNEVALARLSSQQFRTKILLDEAFTHHRFDDAGRENCGTKGVEWNSWCEERSVPGGTVTVFRIGPHVNGTFEGNPEYGYGDRERSAEMTHLWYHLGLVMDPAAQYLNTIDWNYQNAFIDNEHHPLRSLTNYALQVQIFSNGLGNAPEGTFRLNQSWSYGGVKFNRLFGAALDRPTWGALDRATTGKVLEALMRSWWQHTGSYDPASFPRDPANEVRTFDNESYGPRPGEYSPQFEYRSHYYDAWRKMADYHGDEMGGVLDSLTAWGGTMWPLGNDPGYMSQFGNYPLWKDIVSYSAPTSGSQAISLQAGWNLVSSHYQPPNTDFGSVVAGLDNLVIAKSESGNTYIPAEGIDDIETWKADEAYQIYVGTAQTLRVGGSPLDRTASIQLEAGWNLVPYYPTDRLDVATAFGDLGSALVMVKDYAGNTYLPAFGIDEIGTLEPGSGYKVYVAARTSFSYPAASSTTSSSPPPATRSGPAAASASAGSGRPAGLGASATLVVRLPDAASGAEVTAATAAGERLDRGTVDDGTATLALPEDAALTPSVDEGASPGDRIRLRYETEDGTRRRLDVQRVRNGFTDAPVDGLSYRSRAFYVVDAEAPAPLRYRLLGNTPNPARRQTVIEYTLPEAASVTLEVYNVLGQQVATLVRERQEAGTHRARADLSRLGSGVYVYRLEAGGFSASRKMTVVQ